MGTGTGAETGTETRVAEDMETGTRMRTGTGTRIELGRAGEGKKAQNSCIHDVGNGGDLDVNYKNVIKKGLVQ